MTTTDPRARLDEIKQAIATERTLIDGDPFYEVQGYLPDGTPLHECSRWERVGLGVADDMAAALTAVLDLHRPVDIEPSETICHGCSTLRGAGEAARYFPFKEYPCPTVTAITDALGGDRG